MHSRTATLRRATFVPDCVLPLIDRAPLLSLPLRIFDVLFLKRGHVCTRRVAETAETVLYQEYTDIPADFFPLVSRPASSRYRSDVTRTNAEKFRPRGNFPRTTTGTSELIRTSTNVRLPRDNETSGYKSGTTPVGSSRYHRWGSWDRPTGGHESNTSFVFARQNLSAIRDFPASTSDDR